MLIIAFDQVLLWSIFVSLFIGTMKVRYNHIDEIRWASCKLCLGPTSFLFYFRTFLMQYKSSRNYQRPFLLPNTPPFHLDIILILMRSTDEIMLFERSNEQINWRYGQIWSSLFFYPLCLDLRRYLSTCIFRAYRCICLSLFIGSTFWKLRTMLWF